MKYVACYCRVSTEEQKKYGFSIQAQKEALEKYCKNHNYRYEFYIDEGISASSMKKRKALNDMLKKSDVFDMLLFTKLDRLSRNVLDANNINNLLIKNNCTMKAIDEDDIDTSTADGTFLFNLRVSLAQREIGKTSERINFIFDSKRQRGEITSGAKAYGYDIVNKQYVINKKEAQNIIDFYNYFIQVGADTNKTFEYFKNNFPSKSYDAYRKLLTNTSYIGKYKLYRKNIYLEDYIPRIMPDELFFEVQNLLSKKRRVVKNNKEAPVSLFDGILKCSICNASLSRSIQYAKYGTYVNYRCWKHSRLSKNDNELYQCTNKRTISENVIETYLINNIKNIANKYIIENKSIVPKKEVKVEKDNLSIIKKKIEKLKDLYIDDLIDKENYKKDYEKLKKMEKEELEKKQAKAQYQNKDFSKLKEIINSDFQTIYFKLTQLEKRRFWLSIIDKIYISDKEIEKIIFV